jgi:hypothetical protein
MVKIVSYRQKLIELARIYKIDRVFDQNLKLTTYDIEIILLKNKVPIPSRSRGYISHKLINEVYKPIYEGIRKKLSINININININKFIKDLYGDLRKKLSINIYLSKLTKNFYNGIESYFKFIIFNIINFFKILSNTIIDGLNDIYNFKVKEKVVSNLLSKGFYASLLVVLVFSGFYLKNLVTDVDSLKISLEIKSDKKANDKKIKKKEIVKVPDVIKKNNSKKITKQQKNKKSLPADGDYNLNTQTVLNLFEDLEYNLDHVRNKKKVKPIYFTRLPKDLDSIKSVKEKKETFLQILLPLVVAENSKIEEDRKYLLKILKDNESEESKKCFTKNIKNTKLLIKILTN